MEKPSWNYMFFGTIISRASRTSNEINQVCCLREREKRKIARKYGKRSGKRSGSGMSRSRNRLRASFDPRFAPDESRLQVATAESSRPGHESTLVSISKKKTKRDSTLQHLDRVGLIAKIYRWANRLVEEATRRHAARM